MYYYLPPGAFYPCYDSLLQGLVYISILTHFHLLCLWDVTLPHPLHLCVVILLKCFTFSLNMWRSVTSYILYKQI